MYEQYSHLYDRLPLGATGIVMGCVLILLHLIAVKWPEQTKATLNRTHLRPQWGALLMCIDFVWIVLLLIRADWNPLCMPLSAICRMTLISCVASLSVRTAVGSSKTRSFTPFLSISRAISTNCM